MCWDIDVRSEIGKYVPFGYDLDNLARTGILPE